MPDAVTNGQPTVAVVESSLANPPSYVDGCQSVRRHPRDAFRRRINSRREFKWTTTDASAMTKACVLVKVRPGSEGAVAQQAAKVAGVRFAFVTLGRFDVVAAAETRDYAGLQKVVEDLNRIDSVIASETLPSLEVP